MTRTISPLTTAETLTILAELTRLSAKSHSARRRLVLFRLATCCGLRASEIAALNLDDLRFGPSPVIIVRSGKGAKRREVPLYWDVDTLEGLEAYVSERKAEGVEGDGPLLAARSGRRLNRFEVRKVFIQACAHWAGRHATTHAGRHTWISTALRSRSITAVRDAAGHASISTTNRYAHDLEADQTPGSLFTTPLIAKRRRNASAIAFS
jgi:integrase